MAELFHFVAAAVELPVPRACATACKLAQLHALSRLCQYRPAGPPKMHAQNDTKMHSDECKGRSLRFCVRAEQRVCEQLWPQLSVSGLSPRLTSVRPMLSPSFVPFPPAVSPACRVEGGVTWSLPAGGEKKKFNGRNSWEFRCCNDEHHANSTAFLPSSVSTQTASTGQGQGSTSGSASESLHTLYTAIAVNVLPSKPIKTIHKSRSFHTYRRASRCAAKDVPHLEGD